MPDILTVRLNDGKSVSVNITAKNLKYFAFASEENHPMEYYIKKRNEKSNEDPETPAVHHLVLNAENGDLILCCIILGILFVAFVILCWDTKTKTQFANLTFQK